MALAGQVWDANHVGGVGEAGPVDPDELLADYARLQAEAQALRDELKGILAQSLAKTAAGA